MQLEIAPHTGRKQPDRKVSNKIIPGGSFLRESHEKEFCRFFVLLVRGFTVAI